MTIHQSFRCSTWLSDSVGSAVRLGDEAAAKRYLDAIATAVGGSTRVEPNRLAAVLGPSGSTVHISELLPVEDKWLAAIDEYISDLSKLDSVSN
jgi:hypothetical protein